jgi:cysteine synthase
MNNIKSPFGFKFNNIIDFSGNKCILVVSEKDSNEKLDIMRLLGAQVIQVKENMSDLTVAQQIKDNNPNAYVLLHQVRSI